MRLKGNGEAGCENDERQEWVRRFRNSGLSLAQFAECHGLNPTRLHYWVYGAPAGGKSARAVVAPRFEELSLSPTLNSSRWALEVQWPTGAVVRLAAGVEPSWVGAVLGPLRGLC